MHGGARQWRGGASGYTSRYGPDPASAHAAALTIDRKGRRIDTLSGRGRAGAGQEGQDLADGAFPPVRFGQRAVCLDVVAVAAAVLLLDHVAGLDQVVMMPKALRSVMSRLAAMSRRRTPGSRATRSITRAWVVRKVQLVTLTGYQIPENTC